MRIAAVIIVGAAPLPALKACLPDAQWSLGADGHRLTVTFDEPLTPDTVNALALPVLLREGARILEIRRGSSLEQEYLSLSQPPPIPRVRG